MKMGFRLMLTVLLLPDASNDMVKQDTYKSTGLHYFTKIADNSIKFETNHSDVKVIYVEFNSMHSYVV